MSSLLIPFCSWWYERKWPRWLDGYLTTVSEELLNGATTATQLVLITLLTDSRLQNCATRARWKWTRCRATGWRACERAETNQRTFYECHSQVEPLSIFQSFSDKISLDRSIPDSRSKECKALTYPPVSDLPTASIVIIYTNEFFSCTLTSFGEIQFFSCDANCSFHREQNAKKVAKGGNLGRWHKW